MNNFIPFICAAVAAISPIDAQLNDFVANYQFVNSSYCVVYGNSALIAVQTQPFFTRSQYNQFKSELEIKITQLFGYEKVIVCTDSDIFYKAKKATGGEMSEQDIAEMIKSAEKRRG